MDKNSQMPYQNVVWLFGSSALWLVGSLALGSLALWLSGFLALWLSGSLAVWLFESMGLRLCGNATVKSLFNAEGIYMHRRVHNGKQVLRRMYIWREHEKRE
jgi:hypothetical protein